MFGIDKMVGMTNTGMWRSGISSLSSLSGPGADAECGGISGEARIIRSGGGTVKAISVEAGGWM